MDLSMGLERMNYLLKKDIVDKIMKLFDRAGMKVHYDSNLKL
jgi:hypothetical protein